MAEVDFTDDLWLFLSPWCEHMEDHRYFDAIASAWVALWNYTVDPTTANASEICRVCEGLFDMPSDELIDLLSKRRAVFFPNDNRIIESYRGESDVSDELDVSELRIIVTFAEPSR